MTHLFNADLKVRIKIQGCPESGLPALDFRRQHGLPERLDNRADVVIKGEIAESEFRALSTSGFKGYTQDDGSIVLAYTPNGLSQRFDPCSPYGHCATIPVLSDDSPVRLACRALEACKREQRRHDAGADALESELAIIETRAQDIRNQLLSL